ncbi:MAG: GtrA family protein [Saprospiraceae bacterium]|nr:GtrA family protein [Saprospiraceae bacterium]
MSLANLQKGTISIINLVHKPFGKIIPALTFRYAVCGGANTVLDILLYYLTYNFVLGKEMLDLGFVVISSYIAAFMIVFPITFTNGFLLAKYITFTQSELGGRIQLFRYGLTVLGSIILNYLLLKLFVEAFHLFPTLSKVLTTIVVVLYSYYVQKYFSFKLSIDDKH